jgi:DAK2 domain
VTCAARAEGGPAAAAAAAQAARKGADGTAGLTARAGRSSYVSAEAQAGVPDPGACAVAAWLETLAAHLAL